MGGSPQITRMATEFFYGHASRECFRGACGFCPRIFTDKHELAIGDGFTTDYTDDHRPPLESEL